MTQLQPATQHALLHRIAAGQRDGRAPSLVAGVVRDGELAWHAGRGTVGDREPDADTQYRIGSLTKTFVAVLVMRLRDEGLLDLGDRLAQHLPGVDVGDLTIAQLLAHTAGIAAETPPPWWERSEGTARPELADALGADPIRHPPGRVFHYSNPGFAVLGALVAVLRGMPWHQAAQLEILQPLAMSRTTLLPQSPSAQGFAVHPWADLLLPEPATDTAVMAPAGQLWSTVQDLSRFGNFLLRGEPGVLEAASILEMRQPASASLDPAAEAGYGLGMQLVRSEGLRLYGHTGSMPGFVATVWVDAESGLASIALANATSGPAISQIAADLIRIVADREPAIGSSWQPLADFDPALLAITGLWYWGAAPFALRLQAEGAVELSALSQAGRTSRFRPAGDGSWIGLDGYYLGERLQLVRDRTGAVNQLDIGSFVLTRQPYDASVPIPGGVDEAGWRGRT